jgi:hypothetical protein
MRTYILGEGYQALAKSNKGVIYQMNTINSIDATINKHPTEIAVIDNGLRQGNP